MTDRTRDDPPEYGPDDAEAQRITEEYADAAQEHATEEARDAAAERWADTWYQPGVTDPAGGA